MQHVDASGTRIRGESHLLLVGDLGKHFIVVTISGTMDFSISFYHVGKEKKCFTPNFPSHTDTLSWLQALENFSF